MTSKCGPTGKYCYMAFENVCPRCEECIACGDCQCEDDPVEMTEKISEFPDSEVQNDGTEIHRNCGGDILYFKEGWICSKCKESGPDEEEE